MLRAWKHSSKAPHGDPSPWVRVIAHREALRILARRREVVMDEVPEATDPRDDLADSLQRVILLDALRALSDKERVALLLHYWGDLSQPYVAAALQIPLGTVKIRVHRAQAKLCRALQESVA
jgi:RNA polymerase sigma-70 factor (ECF subfamily)